MPGSRAAQLLISKMIERGVTLKAYERKRKLTGGRLSRAVAQKPGEKVRGANAPLDIAIVVQQDWDIPVELWREKPVKGALPNESSGAAS